MGVRLTPGQRCLLDLLQRKLLSTIQSYAMLTMERGREQETRDAIESELQRLKEKIRRISARQKRFTLEIINGNGNNTIPKESFFEALGLVTKEALSKLNSKTNERRRRTTANPRFSHEAIQAKRALEPLQKRLEPRIKDKRDSAKKPQRNHQNIDTTNNTSSTNNNPINNNSNINTTTSNSRTTNSGHNNNSNNGASGRSNNNQQAPNNNNNNNVRASNRTASRNRNRNMVIHNERQELLVQFDDIQRKINSKVSQIKNKRESNKKLELQNELIRKRGLDIISAINMINPNLTFQEDDHNNQISAANQHRQSDQTTQSTEPLDIWIDMKCDESLDGLD